MLVMVVVIVTTASTSSGYERASTAVLASIFLKASFSLAGHFQLKIATAAAASRAAFLYCCSISATTNNEKSAVATIIGVASINRIAR